MAQSATSSSRRVVVRAAGHALALDAGEVSEVARLGQLTQVPLAPPALSGLASLRGRVMPVISMARLLGETASGADARRMVVLRRADPIALAVDEVETVGAGVQEADATADLDDLLRQAFAAARAPQARAMRIALSGPFSGAMRPRNARYSGLRACGVSSISGSP